MTAPAVRVIRGAASGGAEALTLHVPSDVGLIQDVVDLVSRHVVAHGVPDRAATFNLRVALTEALANAIIYGNARDERKHVLVMAWVSDGRMHVTVEDQGAGFDPSRIPDPTSPERIQRPDGRGLFLIRALVDEVRFNDRGNSICMILPVS